MTEERLANCVERVLVALEIATGAEKRFVSPDEKLLVLARAITAVNNRRTDRRIFAPMRASTPTQNGDGSLRASAENHDV
jgi:hypothetical protein